MLSQSRSFAFAILIPASMGAQSLVTYGLPTAGTGGASPALWASTTPRPGESSFAFEVENGLGSAIGAVLISILPADVPLGTLRLNVDPGTLLASQPLSLDAMGSGAVPLPLPNDPALVGFTLHSQGLVIDPAGGFVGIAATPGLRVTPARSGMVLVTRSTGSDQTDIIDLATGSTSSITTNNNPSGVAFSNDGASAFVCTSSEVTLLDATSSVPTVSGTFSSQTNPTTIAMHPDGLRGYLVNQGPNGSNPNIDVINVATGDPAFGTPFPGGGFPAGGITALNMEFSSDGALGYLSSLGFGSATQLALIDTVIGSPTYHQAIASTSFPGELLFWIDVTPNDQFLFAVTAALGANGTISVLNPFALTEIDWDPGAPGIQAIGGEISVPATPLGRVNPAVVSDPRSRYLFVSVWGSTSGTRAGLLRIDIDPQSPNFRSFVRYTTGIPVDGRPRSIAISDAGDRVYLSIQDTNEVHEIDAETMTQLRTFPLGSSPFFIAVR